MTFNAHWRVASAKVSYRATTSGNVAHKHEKQANYRGASQPNSSNAIGFPAVIVIPE
jgi:hypothetical protein